MQLFAKDVFKFKEQLKTVRNVQGICLCGLFVASYVVLSLFNIRISEFLEFRIGFLALAAAGFYGGPIMGMSVGIAGDIISYFVVPNSAPFFPGFTLTYALLGFLFGLILYRAKITPLRAVFASLAEFLVSCTLTTCWLYLMYGMDLKYLLTIRIFKNMISFVVYAILLYVFLKAFSKVLNVTHTPAKAAES
ncbi:MAG: folate family ECF transporter S component [Lachnospiraceae bacterium]|nr:folate family ECF transporter S component [Lachnospiraceae bacterium]